MVNNGFTSFRAVYRTFLVVHQSSVNTHSLSVVVHRNILVVHRISVVAHSLSVNRLFSFIQSSKEHRLVSETESDANADG